MKEELKKINANFKSQIELVTELIDFDKLILDFCLEHFEILNNKLKNGEATKITNPYYLADGAISAIRGIKTNKSFTKNYSNIYNQCLVLLVSHFTLTVEEVFSTILQNQFSNNKLSKNAKNEIQLTLDEIDDVNENPNLLKKLLVTKKKLTFQNMDNIVKSFENFLGIQIDNDPKLDDIKFGFECRHLIVHNLSIADEKFIKNCRKLKMRNIKKSLTETEVVNYSKSELEFIKISMLLFIQELIDELTK